MFVSVLRRFSLAVITVAIGYDLYYAFQLDRITTAAASTSAATSPRKDPTIWSIEPVQKILRGPDKTKLRDDSSDATVMAMAQGYNVKVHRMFVGSLRASGFSGTIILAVEQEMKPGVEDYLISQDVKIVKLTYTECDHPVYEEHEVTTAKHKEGNTCIDPYPDVKIRWGRFPLLRDALLNCEQCTGPALICDARDTFFQLDPFGHGAPEITGLHLFAEYRWIHANNQFVSEPVEQCRDGYQMHGPMLCSGSTIGTRQAMVGYLNAMYEEMKLWTVRAECKFKSHGRDQAIHNYLYYSGAFDALDPQVFRPREGLVNTVGTLGTKISRMTGNHAKELGLDNPWKVPFQGANDRTWIGSHFDITDDKGYFIDYDGGMSRIVHQWDRFGSSLDKWLWKNILGKGNKATKKKN